MPSDLKYIFLDFDETLFNHMAFIDWVDDYLHLAGYLLGDKGSFKNVVNDFHDIIKEVPLLRLYRHQDHMQQTTNQTWDNVSKALTRAVNNQQMDFCYDDAHILFKWLEPKTPEVRILTFGDDSYQRFKINTCRYLRSKHIPIYVVNLPKADFLNQNFSESNGVLVDDKYPLSLPNSWHHIWIDRQARLDKPKSLAPIETKISSLKQVPDVLRSLQ